MNNLNIQKNLIKSFGVIAYSQDLFVPFGGFCGIFFAGYPVSTKASAEIFVLRMLRFVYMLLCLGADVRRNDINAGAENVCADNVADFDGSLDLKLCYLLDAVLDLVLRNSLCGLNGNNGVNAAADLNGRGKASLGVGALGSRIGVATLAGVAGNAEDLSAVAELNGNLAAHGAGDTNNIFYHDYSST